MDTIFVNSKSNKISSPHRVLFNRANKINLRRGKKSIPLSFLSIYCIWKNIKKSKQQI